MSLKRVWTPTNSYSGGGTKRLIVIHSMEGFTGPNGALDCARYFQGNVGASSQVCIDNNRGTIWEGVTRYNGSWTQCNFNSVSDSCEQSGYASWSRDYWLNNRGPQLQNVAEWCAEEAKALGIPIVDLTSSQAQGGSWGICYHSDLGSTGCGHGDPGAGWPFDVVLQWAREFAGGTPPSQPTEVPDMTSAVAIDPQGQIHSACIGKNDDSIYYKSPTDDDFHVIEGSHAYSGVSFDIGPEGEAAIGYTNQGRTVCAYHKRIGTNDPWVWQPIGGQAK